MHTSSESGSFELTDIDPGAAEWNRRWEHRWPDAEPSGPALRSAHPDRWVRLYSLPAGRRPARSDDERATVHARLAETLAVVRSAHGEGDPLIVGEDWDAADGAGGWTRRLLPGARPWRIDADGDTMSYFWVARSGGTGGLVDAVIDDRAAAVLTDAGMAWCVAPYDGGIDVFVPDAAARDAVADRFSEWVSPRPDGL